MGVALFIVDSYWSTEMAKVQAKVMGGAIQEFEGVEDLCDVRKKLGLSKDYTATVNGEPEDGDYALEDFQYVVFAPAVKGGM